MSWTDRAKDTAISWTRMLKDIVFNAAHVGFSAPDVTFNGIDIGEGSWINRTKASGESWTDR